MAKLSDITKLSNCFFTVDGKVLKTMQDVADYLSSCSEENYAYHVNVQKNDFASWTTEMLACPKLGKLLSDAKNLSEARIAVSEFLQKFDYKNKFVPSEKAFRTVDGYMLKSIHEVYYYIHNCSDGSFSYHVNVQKNDFANWINDVLELPALSGRIRPELTKEGIIRVLKDFLLNQSNGGTNPEYAHYVSAHAIQKETQKETVPQATSSSTPITQSAQVPTATKSTTSDTLPVNPTSNVSVASDVSAAPNTSPTTVPEVPVQSAPVVSAPAQEKITTPEDTVIQVDTATPSDITPTNPAPESNVSVPEGLTDDEKITLKPLGLANRDDDEEEPKAEANINKDAFRQYTDEELEKFTAFVRKEKSVDTDVKTEYLRALLVELKNMVKELRLVDKDPFIADLMLRNISAKVDYYALSKNPDDYAHIIRLMKNAQQEIEECSTHTTYNLAEEMFRDLKLQGIAMKKARN